MTSFWPFWIVAPALGALTVGYWITLRRPLGVAGVLARFSRLREEAEFDRGAAVLQAEQAALEAAMAALTAEEFGAPAAESPAAAPAADGRTTTEWPAPQPEASAEPPNRSCHSGGTAARCPPTSVFRCSSSPRALMKCTIVAAFSTV
jgi:hypothetical protein